MNSRAAWSVLALLVLLLFPANGVAQLTGWTFQGAGEFGYVLPTRDLGKNVTDAQEVSILQATANIEPSGIFGAGIEAIAPDERLMIRAMVRQTVNAGATGTVVVCGAFAPGEGICIDQLADAKVTLFSGEVLFLQGTAEQAFRHNFVLGAGLRSYQFVTPACSANPGNPDLVVICELVQEIYQNQSAAQPFLNFGFGFTYSAGPMSINARLIDHIGPYSGGGGNSTGDYQNDLMLMGGLSFRVR